MRRGEAGSSSLETVLVLPALLLVIAAVFQAALWWQAAHAATAAAAEGAHRARVEGASAGAGRNRALEVAGQVGSGLLVDPAVSARRNAQTARVEVSGWAPQLIPGLRLPVRGVAEGPVERFRPDDERFRIVERAGG